MREDWGALRVGVTGFKKKKKVTKQYLTVFMSAEQNLPPLFRPPPSVKLDKTDKRLRIRHLKNKRTKRDSGQTSV